jgi:ElaB/YqjD/DUF883 family membrane-anchored ribosome-binding protein
VRLAFGPPQWQDARADRLRMQRAAGWKDRDESTLLNEFNKSPSFFNTMSDTADRMPSTLPQGDNILSAAEELRAAAAAKAREIKDALKVDDIKTLADRVARETSARWREVSDNAAVYIKDNPGKAALAALGIGFAIGLLFRRD